MIEIQHGDIRGLTLWRPWPWAFTHADKRAENRPNRPPNAVIGHWLALHSGLHFDGDGYATMKHGRFGELARAVPPPEQHPAGVITCVVKVERVTALGQQYKRAPIGERQDALRRAGVDDPWCFGPVVLHTPQVITLPEPVPCKGSQGYWLLRPDVFAAVRAGVRAATGG